eukprot:Gregarina_sp_Pseudo_9__739@NODE_1472_length_1571_cov_6_227807_g1366_i0_p2_GENE_NODE_1472_length_1571_cov_6_227807_g1366_i0NODE_1472_length_1571_cov_6_227807_g1366_i0_p2_ORF_typecomplete_len113_score3_28Cryptochrome_C/PF12546_8/0_044_NODE_1472_length_1571_cov_6_227807_g1366_i0310648
MTGRIQTHATQGFVEHERRRLGRSHLRRAAVSLERRRRGQQVVGRQTQQVGNRRETHTDRSAGREETAEGRRGAVPVRIGAGPGTRQRRRTASLRGAQIVWLEPRNLTARRR